MSAHKSSELLEFNRSVMRMDVNDRENEVDSMASKMYNSVLKTDRKLTGTNSNENERGISFKRQVTPRKLTTASDNDQDYKKQIN